MTEENGIEIDWSGGTIRVGASYGMKVGQANYSSEDGFASFSVELPLPATVEDPASLAAALADVYETLADGAKLATLNQLDQGFYTDEKGVLRPSVFGGGQIPVAAAPAPATPAPVAAAPVAVPQVPAPAPAPAPGTAAAPAGQVYADFGKGPQMYYDNRGKKASGEWKPNAADFTSVVVLPDTGKKHGVWILGPKGNINTATTGAMAAWGIE